MGLLQKRVDAKTGAPVSALDRPLLDPSALHHPLSEMAGLGIGLDGIAQIATSMLDATVVALSLPGENRHWLDGAAVPQTAAGLLAQNFYDDVIDSRAVLAVGDARCDPRLARLIQVEGPPGLRAFAAAPLISGQSGSMDSSVIGSLGSRLGGRLGSRLGVLCVARAGERPFSAKDLHILSELAGLVAVQYMLGLAVRDDAAGRQSPGSVEFAEACDRLHGDASAVPHVCIVIDLAERRLIRDVGRVLGVATLDAILSDAAMMISAGSPPGQAVYRIDPARFALLSPLAGCAEWLSLAERLTTRMRSGAAISQFPFLADAAIGLAPVQPRQRPADLLQLAANAAEAARGSAQGWAVHDPATLKAQQRAFRLLTDLHPILRGKASATPVASCALSLHYQPRIELQTGVCIGIEALLNWLHPDLGGVGAAESAPHADDCCTPRPLTDWVLDRAFAQWALCHADGLDLHLAITLAAANLQDDGFTARVAGRLREHGVLTEQITFAFPDAATVANSTCSALQLEGLADLGLALAIDDNGTGYADLSYLQHVPASVLKLNRAFIGALPGCQRDRAIVRNTIHMAHELGYRVVAEGVDQMEVAGLLREWGCDEAQGELFGHPMPPTGLVAFLQESRAWRPQTPSASGRLF